MTPLKGIDTVTRRTELEGAPTVRTFPNRAEMGTTAANDVAVEMRRRLSRQGAVRMVFAAAPSQSDMLAQLALAEDIDWTRVTAFQMDEYLGLSPDAPQAFGNWLRQAFFDRLPVEPAVRLIERSGDADSAAAKYAALLAEAPLDIVCMGIGQNGHLAFNDPPVADLDDPLDVKIVELAAASRHQQVDDRLFASVEDVPTRAITLTLPRILSADRLFCVVPGSSKRHAVERALHAPVSSADPATGLRTHPDATLYLDAESTPT